jgi:hypothetical protein
MPVIVNEFEFTPAPQTAPTASQPATAQPPTPSHTGAEIDRRLRAHALRCNRLRAD